MISITLDGLAVWCPEDAHALRSTFRIIGKLAGTLSRLPNQSRFMGLPLLLAVEEVWLLLKLGVAKIVSESYSEPTIDQLSEQVGILAVEEKERRAQYEKRKTAILANIPVALRLKRAERGADSLQVQSSISASESAEITTSATSWPRKNLGEVPLPISTPISSAKCSWYNSIDVTKLNASSKVEDYLAVLMAANVITKDRNWRHRCLVFESLWRKGWTLSNGLKFGGDYLVYKGDPILVHSSHIVHVVSVNHPFRGVDIVNMTRLARNARKQVMLCSWNDDTCALNECLTFDWTGWKNKRR